MAVVYWARSHQKKGLSLTDALIKEKFKFFASAVGNSECLSKANNSSWLEKFKKKNKLVTTRPLIAPTKPKSQKCCRLPLSAVTVLDDWLAANRDNPYPTREEKD